MKGLVFISFIEFLELRLGVPALEQLLASTELASGGAYTSVGSYEDAEFGGVTLPRDAVVWAMLASANRDPARFPDPERFDVGRTPNPHLAFAAGPHTCAGMALARIEGKLALSAFFEAFPEATLQAKPLYRERIRFRGLQALHVRLR